MNDGYGGFDFEPYTNGYHASPPSASSPQQQQRQQQLSYQAHLLPAPCFDGYNPASAPHAQPHALPGIDPLPYNPTAGAHHALLQPPPASMLPAGLEPDPISTSVERRHHHHVPHAPQQGGWPLHAQSEQIIADKLLSTPYNSLFHDALDIPSSLPVGAPSTTTPSHQRSTYNPDSWLDSLSIEVSGVSLEPLSGRAIVNRIRQRTDTVVTRYLPCVEFLVSCQQELRAGLAAATHKRMVRHAYRDSMTPRQFYQRYLNPLAERFYRKNSGLMDSTSLTAAFQEISKLCADSRKVEYQGCEAMKNTFLGGMKDGESWGLRKWLSKNGGALHICNDLECILHACQKLDRNADTTKQLSGRLRPMAKQALERLKSEVPTSYQEHSTAHPYLPFFHRLECALRGMSTFDPEDDDVICIDDDDEVEEVKPKASASAAKGRNAGADVGKRKGGENNEQPPTKRAKTQQTSTDGAARFDIFDDFSDANLVAAGNWNEDSDIEVVAVTNRAVGRKQAQSHTDELDMVGQNDSKNELRCIRCTMLNPVGSSRCCMCDQSFDSRENYRVQEDTLDPLDPLDTLDQLDDSVGDLPSFEERAASVTAGIWDPPAPNVRPGLTEHASPSYQHSTASARASPTIGDDPRMGAGDMVQRLENLAYLFDANKQHMVRPQHFNSVCFWDSGVHYASALRLFVTILRNHASHKFLDPVNEGDVLQSGESTYGDVLKHPLCFGDIVSALHGDGKLATLTCWNMWRGMDLLEAIDLVMINDLACIGTEKTPERSQTNGLRKVLWEGINSIVSDGIGPDQDRRICTPMRRTEHSGFVIHKHND